MVNRAAPKGNAMKPFQRLSHGDGRTVTLQLSGIDTAELLDFLKYIGDHFTECADEHLRNGDHDTRSESIELAAIAARQLAGNKSSVHIQKAVKILTCRLVGCLNREYRHGRGKSLAKLDR